MEVKAAWDAGKVMLTNLQDVVPWKAEDITDSVINIPLSSCAQGIHTVTVIDHLHTEILKLIKR